MLPTLARMNAAGAGEKTHYLIRLVRSPIGLPPRSKANLVALGLYRLHQKVLQKHDVTTAGKILRVKELVTVENVGYEEGMKALARRRPEGSGVEVIGKY